VDDQDADGAISREMPRAREIAAVDRLAMTSRKSADLMKRASEVRLIAETMNSASNRCIVLDIASQWEELARQIEQIDQLFGPPNEDARGN
jgi:hypothetical protein